ncbi:MAG: hypothetical protein HHJ09_00610 [Glaciimonas sp.]|nr:hypothetical protein [Glaciimonas sp.]
MIQVAYTHKEKRHHAQQDVLWTTGICVQGQNIPTTAGTSIEDELLFAAVDGLAISPFTHLASRFIPEALAHQTSGSKINTRIARKAHERLCDRLCQRGDAYCCGDPGCGTHFHMPPHHSI